MAYGTRRDLKKEAFWRRMLRGQAQSGLSVQAWCRQHDTRASAFYWWRTQLARRDRAAPTFVPVRVPAESFTPVSAGRIEIVLAGDRRVHVVGPVNRQALADVLAVLTEAPRAEPLTNDPRRSEREAPGC
jgi:transposase-like protein